MIMTGVVVTNERSCLRAGDLTLLLSDAIDCAWNEDSKASFPNLLLASSILRPSEIVWSGTTLASL